MTKSELEELKHRIATEMDVTEFLDILGFTMFDLVDVLEEFIRENQEEFEQQL